MYLGQLDNTHRLVYVRTKIEFSGYNQADAIHEFGKDWGRLYWNVARIDLYCDERRWKYSNFLSRFMKNWIHKRFDIRFLNAEHVAAMAARILGNEAITVDEMRQFIEACAPSR